MTPLPAASYPRSFDSGASPPRPRLVDKMRKGRKGTGFPGGPSHPPALPRPLPRIPRSLPTQKPAASACPLPRPRQHSRRPVPDTQKSTESRFRVTCPLCPSQTRRGGGRAEEGRRGPGKPGGPDSARLRPGGPPLRDPSPSSAPGGSGPPQCSPRAGGLRPRRTLARSLARSLTTVTGDTMAETAAAGTGSGLQG